MLWLDHVLRVVPDFEASERRLRVEYGLEATCEVEYPGFGIVSRLVVIGNGGIELLGVRDATKAAGHSLGRAVLAAAAQGESWLAVAIGTDELDVHARRLGIRPVPVSARTSDGRFLTWRLLGHPLTNEPPLPFLIEWGADANPWPAEHAALNADFTRVKRVEAAGDPQAVARHVGGDLEFISVTEGGKPGLRATVLETTRGETRIV